MKPRYFVVWKLKEEYRALGETECKWRSFPSYAKARPLFDRLKKVTAFRALSFGLGNVLEEHGRP